MGYFKTNGRANINGHEIDVEMDSWIGQNRLYVDGDLRDLKPMSGLRLVLSSNLDGKKLEVQMHLRLFGKTEAWAVWDGGHYRLQLVE